MLFKLTPNYRDLVNLVYSTQSSSSPLTFKQAIASIRRLFSAESVGEVPGGTTSKGLLNRTKSGRIKKKRDKKDIKKDDSGCTHCKKPGHEEKCWFKHPEFAPGSLKQFLEAKGQGGRYCKQVVATERGLWCGG